MPGGDIVKALKLLNKFRAWTAEKGDSVMWNRDLFSPALRNHDGFNPHWEIDRSLYAAAWPKVGARPARAGEYPGTGRPLSLLQAPLGSSRPASGYEPAWCRA
jgi:hypothetical protein